MNPQPGRNFDSSLHRKCWTARSDDVKYLFQHDYPFKPFDLDGTLLNTIDDLGAAANHVLEQHGLTSKKATL